MSRDNLYRGVLVALLILPDIPLDMELLKPPAILRIVQVLRQGVSVLVYERDIIEILIAVVPADVDPGAHRQVSITRIAHLQYKGLRKLRPVLLKPYQYEGDIANLHQPSRTTVSHPMQGICLVTQDLPHLFHLRGDLAYLVQRPL